MVANTKIGQDEKSRTVPQALGFLSKLPCPRADDEGFIQGENVTD